LGNSSARAILHTLDSGEKVMDRVYASNSLLHEKMQGWAIGNNHFYRASGSIDVKKGLRVISDYSPFIVSDLDFVNGYIPYCDLLKKANVYKKDGKYKMEIFHPNMQKEYNYYLEIQNGTIELKVTPCCKCGVEYLFIQGRYALNNTHQGRCFYCKNCLDEHCIYCDYCDNYVEKIGAIELARRPGDSEHPHYACRRCAERGDFVVCDVCGKYESHRRMHNYIRKSDFKTVHTCRRCRDIEIEQKTPLF